MRLFESVNKYFDPEIKNRIPTNINCNILNLRELFDRFFISQQDCYGFKINQSPECLKNSLLRFTLSEKGNDQLCVRMI